MIGLFVTIKLKDGKEQEFVDAAKQLLAEVTAKEKGCRLYVLFKGEPPLTYHFMERYADQAALDAHRATEHMKTIGPKMGACFDGRPQITRMIDV